MKQKITQLSIYCALLTAFSGCATIPGEFSQAGSGKNYSQYLWNGEGKYIVFKVEGKNIEPLLASSSPYSGNKEGLYCITTAAEPCKNFPSSNRDIFSQRSHAKFATSVINAVLNGGNIQIDAKTLEGEKIFDPKVAQNAVNVLSEKIYNQYKNQFNDTSNLLKTIERYEISTNNDNLMLTLAESYNASSKKADKAQIERYLINKSMVKFSNFKHTTSKLKKSKASGLLISGASSGRDYTQHFTVSLDKNAGIPIKYNTYAVKVKVIFYLDFHPPLKGEDEDFQVREETVILSPKNGYKKNVSITLKDLPYIGYVRPAGMGLLTGLGKMMGAISDSEAHNLNKGIPFELKAIIPKYEVVNIQVAK